MSFSKGEIVLLPIPFTDLTSRKVRPAVVIGHSTHVGDLFVVPISSVQQNVDLRLQNWRAAGLNVPCGVKSQIATIEDRLIVKSVGLLSRADAVELEKRAVSINNGLCLQRENKAGCRHPVNRIRKLRPPMGRRTGVLED